MIEIVAETTLSISIEGCCELFDDQYILRQNTSLPSIHAFIAKLDIDAVTFGLAAFTIITTVFALTDSGNSSSWFGENGWPSLIRNYNIKRKNISNDYLIQYENNKDALKQKMTQNMRIRQYEL